MGFAIEFECGSCDYEGSFLLGSGKRTHYVSVKWPVMCADCNSLAATNYLNVPLVCGSCGSKNVRRIDAEELSKGIGHKSQTWSHSKAGELSIFTDIHYLCPKCANFSIKFADYPHLLWD